MTVYKDIKGLKLENIVDTQMNSLLKHATNVGDKKTIL